MKKIISLLVILTIGVNLFGQDISTGPEFRKHRFGLKGTPGVAYFGVNKPGKKNKGLGYHIGGGLNYEYSLSKNVAIASGLIFSQTAGKVEYLDTLGLDYVSIANGTETSERAYRLHSTTIGTGDPVDAAMPTKSVRQGKNIQEPSSMNLWVVPGFACKVLFACPATGAKALAEQLAAIPFRCLHEI